MLAWGPCNLARNSVGTLFLLVVAAIAALPALASDTTPPVLTSFTFTPMAVNTTTSSANVSLTAQITDNLSGVGFAYLNFASPSGNQNVYGGMSLTSGTALNGTWTGSATIPAYSEPGTWTVSAFYTADQDGNEVIYTASDLTALGFPTQLQVTSVQDTQPPVLTSFTFTPMAVNTTTSSANVSLTAQITDNLSGVGFAYLNFASPSGNQNVYGGMSLTSGTALNGTWTGSATIPAYSEPGTWTVSAFYTADQDGNEVIYTASDLTALGFPTQLQVTSVQDTQPPVLTSFTFTPMAVNTTTSSANVNLTTQITDNLSGVGFAYLNFASPSGNQDVYGGMSLTSGTALNGTWTGSATIPAYSEPGTWTVSAFYTADQDGNEVIYTTSDLTALGFPTQLIVDSSTTVVLTSSTDPSAYEQSVTFTATATSSNGITPTGTVNFNDGPTTIGSGTLNASGVTTFTTSSLAVGSHTIVAAYLGDSNDPAADSAPLIQTVNQEATSTTIASSRNPSKAGHPVTFTASVSFANGLPPNGDSVEFFDGQGKLGTVTLNNGSATLTTSRLTAGIHQIRASYLGDTNLQSSKSPPIRQGVKP